VDLFVQTWIFYFIELIIYLFATPAVMDQLISFLIIQLFALFRLLYEL